MTLGSGQTLPAYIVALALAYLGAEEESEAEQRLEACLSLLCDEDTVCNLLEVLPPTDEINAATCIEALRRFAH